MTTTAELTRRGLPYAVIVDVAATPASLAGLDRAGLRYMVEVADGVSSADRAALERRGLRYVVPVAVDATAASKAALDRQGLRYAVQVDADILSADLLTLQRQGLSYYVEVDSSGNSVSAGATGGAGLLVGETDGLGVDFTYATDASRVAVKTAGVVTSQGLDTFFTNAGTSPKMVFDASGALVWAAHNLVVQSENLAVTWTTNGSPVVTAHTVEDNGAAASAYVQSGNISTVAGMDVTASVWFLKDAVTSRFPAVLVLSGGNSFTTMLNTSTGAKSDVGGALVATSTVVDETTHWRVSIAAIAASTSLNVRIYPAYGTVMGVSSVAAVGTVTIPKVHINRGSVAVAYLPTTTAALNGIAVDYDPTTHVCKGFILEGAATNFLLNTTVPLVTQNVTTSVTSYMLSFMGTGTVTLSGTSTAGPLVGTGAGNRVSLGFTPTAGTLTVTVTGTVNIAQLEQQNNLVTSFVPTYGATVTRTADAVTFLLSSIPALGSDYSIYLRSAASPAMLAASRYGINLHDGTAADHGGILASINALQLRITDNSVSQAQISQGTHVAGVMQSAAGRIKANDFAFSVAGAAAATDVAGTLPTVTTAAFGVGGGPSAVLPCAIEKMVIVMPGWNNATLAVKSAT